MRIRLAISALLIQTVAVNAQQRPMSFLDMQLMKQPGQSAVSPDKKWLLYTVSTPNWDEGKRQNDIYLVSMDTGVPSTRQLTFTKDKSETAPAWAVDGRFFAFLSDRAFGDDKSHTQLWTMRADGGEARQLTTGKDTVYNFAFSPDGQWLVYRAGRNGEPRLYVLPIATLDSAEAQQVTRSPLAVHDWRWAPDSKRIYFTADTLDTLERDRREKKFTVTVRNAETPVPQLYSVDVVSRQFTHLTHDPALAVTELNISRDGRWVGFSGTSSNRYERNVTEQDINTDLFLLETATGRIERLTNNKEVGERGPSFSPDSRYIAFSGPDNLEQYSMTNDRVYLRRVDDTGGKWQKLGESFDGDVTVGFWSDDGKTIYFNEGVRATNEIMALDIAKNTVRPVTTERAAVSARRDTTTGVLLVDYADGATPSTTFTVASVADLGTRAKWRQITDLNPQVRSFALGEQEEVTWTSKDGKNVSGVLVKPAGYQAGKRYPLIVAIHGGPAGADILGFNGGYGSQVYAGAGYVVLRPNYRGSTNYGEAFRNGIVGNYFPPGFDDIMSGVDYLIAQGIVDGDRMGALGWSAGGHWSNWILTHTDRFKAISTGAGTSNWISMYAESDVQRNRQFYLGNKLPYDDFDAYWNQSPLKYIKNAKTPTMIHVVEGDPRVPSPQSIELHMALKKLGVPTELYLYPGRTHGIPDPRNQLFKSMAEMAWMDYYVRGKGQKFSWRDVLSTVEKAKEAI
jgi:dipeptidyl aminopeptidase/acylaminoacyl peptidase